MAIPNVKRYRISNADGSDTATIMAVLPKGADVDVYLKDASQRFDWKAWSEMKSSHHKVRIGQQKQRKSK